MNLVIRSSLDFVRSVGLTLFGPVFGLFLLLVSVSVSLAADKPERKLISYKEADVQVDEKSVLAWVTPDMLVFSVRKPNARFEKYHFIVGDFVHEAYTEQNETFLFDTTTGKATHHLDGRFESFKDGVMTISTKMVLRKDGYPNPKSDKGAYSVLLKGPLGKEKEVVLNFEALPKKRVNAIGKCPNNNEEGAIVKDTHNYALQPGHGCIEEIPVDRSSGSYRYRYFRADGKVMELDTKGLSFLKPPKWVTWLNAYVLHEPMSTGNPKTDAVKRNRDNYAWLMSPNGRLLEFAISDSSFAGAIPTRAGLIAEHLDKDEKYAGYRLYRGDKVVQITKGRVINALLADDGCRLAYVYESPYSRFLTGGHERRLRVIDVCESFGVSKDANPFKW